jgi:phage virion morphogenesis protein
MLEAKVEINALRAEAALERLAQAMSHRASLMAEIAGIMHGAVEENFAREGRPAWLGLKPGSWLSRAGALTKTGQVSAARYERNVRGGKILQRSGQLAASITPASDNDSAMVGTNKVYARIHQFGGTTKPHVIEAKNKQALAWATGGHPVKKVNHPGSVIPARPFLLLTDEDEAAICETVTEYLRRAL